MSVDMHTYACIYPCMCGIVCIHDIVCVHIGEVAHKIIIHEGKQFHVYTKAKVMQLLPPDMFTMVLDELWFQRLHLVT